MEIYVVLTDQAILQLFSLSLSLQQSYCDVPVCTFHWLFPLRISSVRNCEFLSFIIVEAFWSVLVTQLCLILSLLFLPCACMWDIFTISLVYFPSFRIYVLADFLWTCISFFLKSMFFLSLQVLVLFYTILLVQWYTILLCLILVHLICYSFCDIIYSDFAGNFYLIFINRLQYSEECILMLSFSRGFTFFADRR